MNRFAIALLLFATTVTGLSEPPVPATPATPAPAAPPTGQVWTRFDLYQAGRQAYAENRYGEAYAQLTAFKTHNDRIFSTPPEDLKPKIAEILQAIEYSRGHIVAATAAAQAAERARAERMRSIGRNGGDRGVFEGRSAK
jgi:hypothetical protein